LAFDFVALAQDEQRSFPLKVSKCTNLLWSDLEALDDLPRPGGQGKVSGKQEAYLIAVAGTPAPPGQGRWTLELLAEQVVALGFAESIARETVCQVLKKTRSTPGSTSRGVSRR